jgi:hypothetical protein
MSYYTTIASTITLASKLACVTPRYKSQFTKMPEFRFRAVLCYVALKVSFER